jgi:hypothetical protein
MSLLSLARQGLRSGLVRSLSSNICKNVTRSAMTSPTVSHSLPCARYTATPVTQADDRAPPTLPLSQLRPEQAELLESITAFCKQEVWPIALKISNA